MTERQKIWSHEEILKEVIGKFEELSEQPAMGYCGIHDCDNRWKRLWKKVGENQYVEVDVKTMVNLIAEYLSKHVTIDKLLKDKLLHQPLETIFSLHERIQKKAVVKEKKGCYSLVVKGKSGKPLELEL